MKILLTFLIASVASVVAADNPAPDHAVEFSKYSPALTLISYDKKTDTFRFKGTIRLRGTLFVEFDMDTPKKANGDINFLRFVPDPDSAAQLPAVIGGFYPSPVRYVDLDVQREQIDTLFEREQFVRLSHGTQPFVSRYVSVTLHSYDVTVECDSRTYIAQDVQIESVAKAGQLASVRTPPDGCS
jgi:hypothetical protein